MTGDENKLVYNGTDLRTLHLYVSGNKTFNSPVKEYEKISIPGRSGDLFIFNNRYSNVELEYDAIITPPNGNPNLSDRELFEIGVRNIREVLLAPNGYVRIEDGYHPEEYRLGVFEGPLDVDVIMLSGGQTTLTFNCRPERFLTSGEEPTDLDFGEGEASILSNNFYSVYNVVTNPIIKLKGAGEWSITVNSPTPTGSEKQHSCSFTVDGDNTNFVYIDSEERDVYKETSSGKVNWNSHISFYNVNPNQIKDDFPHVYKGLNTITAGYNGSNQNASLQIIPRWYRL